MRVPEPITEPVSNCELTDAESIPLNVVHTQPDVFELSNAVKHALGEFIWDTVPDSNAVSKLAAYDHFDAGAGVWIAPVQLHCTALLHTYCCVLCSSSGLWSLRTCCRGRLQPICTRNVRNGDTASSVLLLLRRCLVCCSL